MIRGLGLHFVKWNCLVIGVSFGCPWNAFLGPSSKGSASGRVIIWAQGTPRDTGRTQSQDSWAHSENAAERGRVF